MIINLIMYNSFDVAFLCLLNRGCFVFEHANSLNIQSR